MKYGKLLAAAVTATVAATIVLPALAMENGTASSAMTHDAKKTVNIACVATAVAKRESALGTAWTTSSTAISAAFSKRATDLAAAWAKTDAKARKEAIKTAWSTFQTSRKAARTGWMTAQKSAWSTFKTDVKACGATTAADQTVQSEQAGSQVDAQ